MSRPKADLLSYQGSAVVPTGGAEMGSDEEGSARSGDDEDENEAPSDPKHLAAETQRVLRGMPLFSVPHCMGTTACDARVLAEHVCL